MGAVRRERLISVGVRLFGFALLAYPPAFRQAWGREMRQLFRDTSRERAREGLIALTHYWTRAVADLAVGAAAERWQHWQGGSAMDRAGILVATLTALGAAGFCWLCLHTDETGILACTALLLAGVLALARPRRAWFAALLLGLAAPTAQLLGHLLASPVPAPRGPVPQPGDWSDVAAASLALLFSTAGALGGAGLRRLLTLSR